MKKLLFFLILSVLFSFSCKKQTVSYNKRLAKASVCNCKGCVIPKPGDTYNYPVKAGTKEWAQFTSHAQMLAACQVPFDTLSKMSTEGVIQTCMDYPLFTSDLFLNWGVNVVRETKYYMKHFSGMMELTRRPDAGKKMLDRYLMICPQCAKNYQDRVAQGIFSKNLGAYEMMFGYDSIIIKLNIKDRKRLVKAALDNYYCKKSLFPDYYSYYGLSTSLYLAAKVMIVSHYDPFLQAMATSTGLKQFMNELIDYSGTMEKTFNIIIKNAAQFEEG